LRDLLIPPRKGGIKRARGGREHRHIEGGVKRDLFSWESTKHVTWNSGLFFVVPKNKLAGTDLCTPYCQSPLLPSPSLLPWPSPLPPSSSSSSTLLTKHHRPRRHRPCCPHPLHRCPHQPRALVNLRRPPLCSCPPPTFAAPVASLLLSFYPTRGRGIQRTRPTPPRHRSKNESPGLRSC
jgi:hypothetical protein